MSKLNVTALREIAEAANKGIYMTEAESATFDYTFTPEVVLELLDEIDTLRSSANA